MSQSMNADGTTLTNSDSSIRPSKYNGKTNFSAWKLKMLAYLQALSLKDHVVVTDFGLFRRQEGSNSPEDPGLQANTSGSTNPNKTRAILMKKSEKAYAVLLNSLEDDIIDLVTCKSRNIYAFWPH